VPIDPTRKPYRLAAEGRVLVQVPEDFPFITQGLAEPSKPARSDSK